MTRIIEALLALITSLLKAFKRPPEPLPSPALSPIPQTPPAPVLVPSKPVLTAGVDLRGHSPAWCGGTLEDRKNMLALARRVCQEEGLTKPMTEDLLLTVYGESGFNQWCINLKSLDFGIAQFSHVYYLKEYKMTRQEAIDNPERCLRIMARNFRGGRQSNWVAYKGRFNHVNNLKQLSA